LALEDAALNPSFLIGGVPNNFGVSACLTDAPFFVIEADEYDTAFLYPPLFGSLSGLVWVKSQL
jgi:UDP-N-acetylmuramate-alanine ligase